MVSIPLLKDLSYDEAKTFVNAGTVIKSRAGDVLVRAGDVGNEMYVVLTGSAEDDDLAVDLAATERRRAELAAPAAAN